MVRRIKLMIRRVVLTLAHQWIMVERVLNVMSTMRPVVRLVKR